MRSNLRLSLAHASTMAVLLLRRQTADFPIPKSDPGTCLGACWLMPILNPVGHQLTKLTVWRRLLIVVLTDLNQSECSFKSGPGRFIKCSQNFQWIFLVKFWTHLKSLVLLFTGLCLFIAVIIINCYHCYYYCKNYYLLISPGYLKWIDKQQTGYRFDVIH